MHFTSQAMKSDAPAYQNVFTLCKNSGLLFFCLLCLCFSSFGLQSFKRCAPLLSTRRGQCCPTPALTAMQLHGPRPLVELRGASLRWPRQAVNHPWLLLLLLLLSHQAVGHLSEGCVHWASGCCLVSSRQVLARPACSQTQVLSRLWALSDL